MYRPRTHGRPYWLWWASRRKRSSIRQGSPSSAALTPSTVSIGIAVCAFERASRRWASSVGRSRTDSSHHFRTARHLTRRVSRDMKRVLVTGGAGFISSGFVHHLLAATPHEVVTLDALTYAGNLENLADVMAHPRLSFVHGDIRDRDLVRSLVAEVDVIVNAAAESHVEKSIEEGASEFVTTNVEGTQILLDAIRQTPVERFILISSSEVYGTAEYAPMDEEHPLNPRSPYAATKAGADRLAYSYFVTYGLPITIVRPFNNYGPRQHPEK